MLTLKAIVGFLFIGMGLAIGLAATWQNMRSAKGPKERAFVRFNCVAAWLVIMICFALLYYLPSPWRYFVLVPYFISLPIAIYRATTKRQLIRRVEEMEGTVDSPSV